MAIIANAQQISIGNAALFYDASVCSTGGINSTFTGSWANKARALSEPFNFLVYDKAGTPFLADHAMLEVTCDKADDDSLIVLLLGYSQGDTSSIYYDTLYVKAVANKVTYAVFSPSLTSSSLDFPTMGRLSVANEDSGANGAFPYFGVFPDTNIWTMRLVAWKSPYEVSGATTITIGDYQLDSDTTSWDATKTDLDAEQDTSSALTWPDTVATIVTVSDTTVMSARISAKPDSGAVAFMVQAETIAGNWINTANPWAADEIVSTMATEAEVPGLETDAAHDNISELGGAASDAQVPNDITLDTTNATDVQWDQYIEQHQTQVGDYLDPADSADAATRTYVDTQDNAQDDFSELSGTVADAQIAAGAVDGGTAGEIQDSTITAADLTADAVSAEELNATGVEAELEAVLDLSELQGSVTDAQVPDNITITETGDISAVTAGDGLSGGGADGAVTVTANVLSGGGIAITTDSLEIDDEVAQDLSGAMFTGNTETGITVTYQDDDGTVDLVVSDFLDPADSAGVAYRDWVSGLDFLDPADSADVAYRTWVGATYQPLEATLTDIADGTIAENLVNTAYPFAVNEGGTGANTLTDGGLLVGSGTDAITALGVATNGQIPVGDGTTDPVLATMTGTANELTVTNGAGTITLSLPEQIAAVPLKKNFSVAIVNPKHLVADTSNIWANLTGVVYTIDSILVETDGSVDDFDFTLVEMPLTTGAAAVIEAMQVGTETGTARRQNWFTSIDNGTIASGAKIGIVTPADSTDQLLIQFYGNLTP
jgi:hypothetical protein